MNRLSGYPFESHSHLDPIPLRWEWFFLLSTGGLLMKVTLTLMCTVLVLAVINLSQNPLTEIEKYKLRQLVSELADSISDNTSNEMSISRVIESIDAVFKSAAH